MANYQKLLTGLMLLLLVQTGQAQTYKAGDKAEALVNNVWKEVKIVKAVAGKTGVYEISVAGTNKRQGIAGNTIQVNQSAIRSMKQQNGITTQTTAVAAELSADPHLGKYDLYSGIPSMYIGHIVLQTGGKYRVALSTDESNYELGTYKYDAASNSIEWLTGFCRNSNWKGKITNTSGVFRIELNRASFAESN